VPFRAEFVFGTNTFFTTGDARVHKGKTL